MVKDGVLNIMELTMFLQYKEGHSLNSKNSFSNSTFFLDKKDLSILPIDLLIDNSP